jgi:hypothetical protein
MWESDIATNVRKMGYEDVHWFQLSENEARYLFSKFRFVVSCSTRQIMTEVDQSVE